MAVKFKELRQYVSRIVRVSVCFEDGHYDNYTLISDIPQGRYDEKYVFGVGMIDVEFPRDVYLRPETEMPDRIRLSDGYFLGAALEIVIRDRPREDIERVCKDALKFGDLRNYLQTGRYFSVVMQEDWSSREYEWRDDIPQEYNSLFVYGIGMENEPGAQFVDPESALFKRMVIVLADRPKE